ncbi:MAG: hypothetical protein QNL90_11150 [Gammaproteobacteria bacterium]|nr:hypothetical protein [Gammaproteobacteria bacterium]
MQRIISQTGRYDPVCPWEFPTEDNALWKRVSSYGNDYVPRSMLEQQIVLQSWTYEWSGGEPDPGQLPEGYKQLEHDRSRARRTLQSGDKIVLRVIWLLAFCVGVLVLRSM